MTSHDDEKSQFLTQIKNMFGLIPEPNQLYQIIPNLKLLFAFWNGQFCPLF